MLPAPYAMPPSSAGGPRGYIDVTELVLRSIRASDGFAVHSGTQRLPAPTAKPAHASPGSSTLATRALVLGSMRLTAKGPVLATHTASAVIATQSAVSPSLNVASGLSSPIGRCGAARH